MDTLTGNYAGIGALLQKNAETGEVAITKVYADTPAEKSGLKEGDIIVSADGNIATEEDLDVFVQHIRGEAGISHQPRRPRNDNYMYSSINFYTYCRA